MRKALLSVADLEVGLEEELSGTASKKTDEISDKN